MPSLPKLIPDVDHLLSMEPEELATYVLVAASDQRQNNIIAMSNFISGLVSTSAHPAAYTDQRRDEIGLAITEAWNWLEVQGLLIPAPGINGGSGFRMLSRRAIKMKAPEDIANFARSRRIQKELLHPRIAQQVWAAFMRSEFDIAVFQAMKAVEVAVREAGGFSAGDLGTNLMRSAFQVETGPLTDPKAERSERQARSDLFAGAIGSYKMLNRIAMSTFRTQTKPTNSLCLPITCCV